MLHSLKFPVKWNFTIKDLFVTTCQVVFYDSVTCDVFTRLFTWPASVCQTVSTRVQSEQTTSHRNLMQSRINPAISRAPTEKTKIMWVFWEKKRDVYHVYLGLMRDFQAWFIFSSQMIKAELIGVQFISGFLDANKSIVGAEIWPILHFTEAERHVYLSSICGLLGWFKNGIFIDELQVGSSSVEMTSSSVIPPRNRLDYTIDRG